MEFYKTQQPLMAEMAKEKGIPTSEITTQFQRKLDLVYEEDRNCVQARALCIAEYRVWKEFFPNDSWPGIDPELLLSADAMSPESGEVLSSPDKMDFSSLPTRSKSTPPVQIEDVLLDAAGDSAILVAYNDMLRNVKERYPRESLEWQRWMSGSKVWLSNFHQNGNFPCNEPSRSYDLVSSDIQPRRHGEAGYRRAAGSDIWQGRFRSPPVGPKGMMAREPKRQSDIHKVEGWHGSAMKPRQPTNDTGIIVSEDSVKPSALPPALSITKESEMQKRAYERGGHELRHKFFWSLQNCRDIVKSMHPNIERGLFHWKADWMAWKRIFGNEPCPWLDEKPPGAPMNDFSTGNLARGLAMAAPPSQGTVRKFNANNTIPANNSLVRSDRKSDKYRPRYAVQNNNLKQSTASHVKIMDDVKPTQSTPVISTLARSMGHGRTASNISSMKSQADVEGVREVTIKNSTAFHTLLGSRDGSFKSVQRALGVTIENNIDSSEYFKLTIEPYKPGDYAALERAYKFLQIWEKLICSNHFIKLDHFWGQYEYHDATIVSDKLMIHVNGKKLSCAGRFGDLCEYFSNEIQAYQSSMAKFAGTENALACSILFEARPSNIYINSYPLPIMLQLDSKTRNKVLDEHDAFLEEWVQVTVKDVRNPRGLSELSNEYARRRDQRYLEKATNIDIDMDLDELLREGAVMANQKRKPRENGDGGKNGRFGKRQRL